MGAVHGVVLLVRAQVADGAQPLAAKHARARHGGGVGLQVLAKRVHAGLRAAARHARQRALARVGGFLVHL